MSYFIFRKNVSEVLFVPYALTDQDEYTNTVSKALMPLGKEKYCI